VQGIFALYLQRRSLEAVLAEVQARQWTTKRWMTREGKEHLGRSFTKITLERLLRNVLYLGQVSHQGEIYPGEQAAVVENAVWERVHDGLAKERDECCVAAALTAEAHKTRSRRRPTERVPRVTRLLALALKFEEMVRSGVVGNYAVLAQLGRVTRSRVTQMTNLLNLAPDIQEEILFLSPDEAEQLRISEPLVRKLSAMLEWGEQRAHWRRLRHPV
jgi:hypothetical protein